jgi:hypothetical protein
MEACFNRFTRRFEMRAIVLEETREAPRLMEANQAGGTLVIVHN